MNSVLDYWLEIAIGLWIAAASFDMWLDKREEAKSILTKGPK